MKQSNELDQLIPALIKAQSEMGAVVKSEIVKGKKFSYGYATFEDIMEVVKPVLKENGLALSFLLDNLRGEPALTTVLAHTSGQFYESTIPLISVAGGSNAAQALGIIITYTKRYSSGAMFSLPIIDDTDGRFGDDDYEGEEPEPEPRSRRKRKPEPEPEPEEDSVELDIAKAQKPIDQFARKWKLPKSRVNAIMSKRPLEESEDMKQLKERMMYGLRGLADSVITDKEEELGLSKTASAEPLNPLFKAFIDATAPKEIDRITEESIEILNMVAKDAEEDDNQEDNEDVLEEIELD
jgi:hypothetical protein